MRKTTGNTVATMLLGFAAAAGTAACAGQSAQAAMSIGSFNTVNSSNWAGYAATTSSPNAFTSVSGGWTIPTVTNAGGSNSAAAFWVEPVALSRPQNSQNCIGVWRRRLQRCQFVVSWCLKAWPRSLSW